MVVQSHFSIIVSDPYLLTLSLLEQALSKGVIFKQGKLVSLATKNGRVSEIQMLCGDKTISLQCDNFVLAAGPWSGQLAQTLLGASIPITPYAGHSIVLQPSIPTSADTLFAILHSQRSSYRAEVIPRSSGEIYISGINNDLDLPPTPSDAIPLESEIAKLKEVADMLFSDYVVKNEQLCFRPMTESGNPIICAYPKIDGVYIATGHSHFGIILGPGTGKVLSELILGEELSVDIAQFALRKQ
jgi:glycine/D-amino acid oxidase-like deaminating enzyme